VRRLVLLRHGKSAWDEPGLDDFDRPLAPRGLRDVPEMGRRLARRGMIPDGVISSSAVRALSTARAVAREIGFPEDRITSSEALYLASAREMISIVRQAPVEIGTLLLVGHNPGLTNLANQLDEVRMDNMPTAAMLCVEFDVADWAEIQPAGARFDWFDYPKKHAGA